MRPVALTVAGAGGYGRVRGTPPERRSRHERPARFRFLRRRYLMGDRVAELEPFALSRYAAGKTFGASQSHSPWV